MIKLSSAPLSFLTQNTLPLSIKQVSFGFIKISCKIMTTRNTLILPVKRLLLPAIFLACLLFIASCTALLAQGTERIEYGKYFQGFNQPNPGLNSNYNSNLELNSSSAGNIASSQNGTDVNFNLFGNFGNNIINSFKGNNLYLHLAGIALTSVLVTQNVDYKVEHFFNQHPDYGNWARPILVTGQLLPFIVGGGLYAYGKFDRNDEFVGASFAVLQASLIEFLYNSTLKAITGRPGPDWRHNSDMESLSKTFRFGFLRGGVFWGWPSGHTSATMAVVSALTNYYPNVTWLKIVGYTWVAYTIFGVSSVNRGGMHWFSDAIAAALMSYAVGSTVGKYYRSVYNNATSSSSNSKRVNVMPEVNPIGINLSFQF